MHTLCLGVGVMPVKETSRKEDTWYKCKLLNNRNKTSDSNDVSGPEFGEKLSWTYFRLVHMYTDIFTKFFSPGLAFCRCANRLLGH